jgi:oxygen-independent coproporphyrinogen III oxidase
LTTVTVTDPISLYLHIPFCGTRCTYCAFNTYTTFDSLIPAYVEAMCNELRLLGRVTPAPLHTIYFGGGTPSLLSAAQIGQIIDTCRRHFNVRSDAEITLEVNPGSIDAAYFVALRETGVNRLSIGMQSAHESELKLFQRDHGVDAVPITVERARAAGFDSLSLDLIYGVPNQTLAMWEASVRTALSLRPDHLSMYSLQLEDGTPMTKQVQRGLLTKPDDDLAADMYELADELVTAQGLSQYEISNWARLGHECKHNLQYWRNLPYLGVGAGAHGYAAGLRYEVVRPIPKYIELASQPDAGLPYPLTNTVERSEPIDVSASMAEHMMTGLRLLREGIDVRAFEQRFGVPLMHMYGDVIERFTGYGLLKQDNDHVYLTPNARLVSNQIFLEFFPV